ncbi:MAG: Fic family protein [Boseongicola sp. SB0677_bin_26]|nr:Fic family protein [Boseongicola sp. SB0665_bin_10]MYG27612.1 Fic family protein [Boseongicola sp. SB0677_bin_26]
MTRKGKVIAFLAEHRQASAEDVRLAVAPEMTRQTFWRDLKALEVQGFVIADGRGSGTRWSLSGPAAVRRFLKTPSERRPDVGYDMSFLDDYIPNRTFYLGTKVRESLTRAGTPPTGRSGPSDRRVLERFLTDLSWTSSRLEGNTYSLAETERLIRFGEAAEGRTREETVMILNHQAAIEYLCPNPDVPALSAITLRNVHALVSHDLLGDPMWEGAMRTHVVEIGGSAYKPLDDPHRIREAFETLISKAAMIADPFEQAFFITVHVPYLQAFEDCNKRTSRIAANIPLLDAGLSPLSFLDVTHRDYVDGLLGIYELHDFSLAREVFAEAYVKSARRYWAPSVRASAPSRAIVENRDFITNAVRNLVKRHRGFDAGRAGEMVRDKGLEGYPEVLDHVRRSIEGLHEGNLIRYGLDLDDLERLRGNAKTLEGCETSGKDGTGSGDRDWTPPELSPLDDMDDPYGAD